MAGRVYLVGAGPGDPGLITVKGMEILRRADVVVYDALANPALLGECPGAELVDVGKRSSRHTKSQEEINALLVERASAGSTVVRLKGGDPFLFGRGAEEALELRRAGVDVSVVPGISSSISVPELSGIPVTHRDRASMVTIATGHEKEDKADPLRWERIAGVPGTLVILMGVANAGRIAERLIAGGKPADTPAAVIASGSTESQRTVITTLSELEAAIAEQGLEAPAVIVVGDVVSEREGLGDLS